MAEALHFVPPILAFAVGIVVAAWLRRAAGDRASAISTLIEIVLLVAVGILHNRLPDLAGTLGISFVAAMQTAIFTKVEGVAYSSVMITGNIRQAIEGACSPWSRGIRRLGSLRRSGIFCAFAPRSARVRLSAPSQRSVCPISRLSFLQPRCFSPCSFAGHGVRLMWRNGAEQESAMKSNGMEDSFHRRVACRVSR